jgi:hypothetical protein
MAQESQASTCSGPLPGDKWRPEEDEKLLELVGKDMGWKNISKEIVGRSGRGCCDRYRFMLKHIWNNPKTHDIMRLYNEYDLTCI